MGVTVNKPFNYVQNLSKRYPDAKRAALNHVGFNIQAGELVVVLGRSGSGKTTLFRCLNRLVNPDSGIVRFNEQDLIRLRGRQLRAARKNIATIFQQYNLIRTLTVMDNVLATRLDSMALWRVIARTFPRTERQWALHCLHRVGLLDYAARRASSLSGGQQQRVAIARALAQQATLILADEPIASLDAESAHSVLRELRQVTQDGVTVLCSLHQEEFALQYATRIIGLRDGELVVDIPCDKFNTSARAEIYLTS